MGAGKLNFQPGFDVCFSGERAGAGLTADRFRKSSIAVYLTGEEMGILGGVTGPFDAGRFGSLNSTFRLRSLNFVVVGGDGDLVLIGGKDCRLPVLDTGGSTWPGERARHGF